MAYLFLLEREIMNQEKIELAKLKTLVKIKNLLEFQMGFIKDSESIFDIEEELKELLNVDEIPEV